MDLRKILFSCVGCWTVFLTLFCPVLSDGAEFEPQAFAITQATVITGPGQQIENGRVIIRGGLVIAVGTDVAIPPDAEIIDAKGWFVYPGFIDAATPSLLNGDRPAQPAAPAPLDVSKYALAATRIDNRKSLTPEFEAAEHLRIDGDILEKRRQLGFTAIHVVPAGRLASGRGALLSTRGTTLRESLHQASTMTVFRVFGPGEEGYPHTLMGGTAHLRQLFLDARRYAQQTALFKAGTPNVPRPFQDVVLEGLQPVLVKQIPVWFQANTRDEIERALSFSAEQEISKFTLWGGHDAARCLDRLKERQIPVVLSVDFGDEPKVDAPPVDGKLAAELKEPLRVQEHRRDHWRQLVGGPKLLNAAGVKLAIGSQHLNEPAELFKGIRQLIQAGLPRDVALAAITSDAAAILGQESRLGTIAPGKLGHLTILTGPFDDERSKVRLLLVDGKKFEFNKDAQPVPKDAGGAVIELSGEWKLDIEAADGAVHCDLNLVQTGTRLNGIFKSPQGDGKLTSGKVEQDQAEWVVSIGAGDREIALKFSAQAQPVAPATPPAIAQRTQLKGTLKSAFGAPASFVANRVLKPGSDPKTPKLTGIEDDAAKAAAGPAVAAVELPLEFDADRMKRAIPTGGNVLIQKATILTGRGETLAETSILIKAGKIAAIGKDLQPEAGMAVIDGTGKFVMPGIIDTHSHIMIGDGIGSVNEATLSIVPEVRVKDAIWTDDVSAYRALAGGVTTARLFHGSANVIGGQDAVVKLKYGEPASRQIIADAPQGVKFALGENVKAQHNRFPNTRMGVEATLNRAFVEALDYRRQWMEHTRAVQMAGDKASQILPPRRDLRLEALMDIVNQQKFIHSHCYRADEILMLLRVANGLGVRVWSLQHVLEGYKVAPEIAAHGSSCSTFSDWWAYKVEAYDATPFNAALLNQAGINSVIKSDDWELIRHLYLEAAKTVRYGGLSPETALQLVTSNPARELGLQNRIGSLEVGKDGDLGIYNGHPLHAFSRCEMTLIEGEVYFERRSQPSAMTAAGAGRLQAVNMLPLPTPEIRARQLDLQLSPNGQYALVGGTVHPVDSADIPGGTVLVAGGKITAVGKDIPIPAEAKKIDVTGLHVYPGLIDSGSTLGLTEIGRVSETHDYSEAGQYQPDLRAGVAVNPDSELIPVARAGGITTVLAVPSGGTISGQASAVKLGGWTVPDMVLDLEVGLVIRWPGVIPEHQPRKGPIHPSKQQVEERQKQRKEQLEQLKEFLKQGRLYLKLKADTAAAGQSGPIPDPRYDALKPYLSGEKRVFVEASQRQEIAEALLFADDEKLKIVVMGGTDAWKLAPELKARNVPVIVGPVMTRPVTETDPFDAPYANAGRLFEAGVSICIRSDDASNSRNAPFEAAQAVAYGLPAEEGLKSVTLNAAKILGIDAQVGSLTTGKLANIVITDGSPLLQITQIKGTFIDGQPYLPETRQTRLYEKYRQRLKK
ncbi:MAG: imidazolonepropionase [Planctomycetaceae bacterium]|nr:imidazolonepropionase [Planctomycetaceae bacterium]